jgi:hypothetical protein
MKREFIKHNGRRKVKSAIYKYRAYHLECAPDNAEIEFVSTEKSCCAKCHLPLYKKEAANV